MMEPDLTWMSEDIIYVKSIPSCLSGKCRVQKGSYQIQFWRFELALCSICVFHAVVQDVLNWFTGIQNPFEVRG